MSNNFVSINYINFTCRAYGMVAKLISEKHSQKSAWSEIWNSDKIMNKIVDWGRGLYNVWFLSVLKDYVEVDNFCELGCGSSTLLSKIADFSKYVVGIDYSPAALRRSRALFKRQGIANGRFINDDCRNLRVTEKFDTVWSQGLIEHFSDPAKVIQQHLKITKTGGHTIISVPYKYGYTSLWYVMTRPKLLNRLWPWTEQLFFSRRMLENNLKKYCSEQTDYNINVYPLVGIIILVAHKNEVLSR